MRRRRMHELLPNLMLLVLGELRLLAHRRGRPPLGR